LIHALIRAVLRHLSRTRPAPHINTAIHPDTDGSLISTFIYPRQRVNPSVRHRPAWLTHRTPRDTPHPAGETRRAPSHPGGNRARAHAFRGD